MWTSFGPPCELLDLVRHVGELEALLAQHLADDAFDLPDQAGIDEGVETDHRVVFLQLLVNLRDLDLLRSDVVDDLDALPLLHVVGDDLADRPVGELVVAGVDPEVVEEVGVPQPVEVVDDHLLGRVVVRQPDAFRRPALFQLDVIEIGLRLDDRRVALGFEAGRDEEDDGAGSGGRLRARGGLGAAHRDRRQGRLACRRRRRACPEPVEGSWAAAGAATSESTATANEAQPDGHWRYFRLTSGPFGRARTIRVIG